MFIYIYIYIHTWIYLRLLRVAFQCAFVYSSARIKSGAMTRRLKAAVFWKNRDIKFFCFIKRRMRKYYLSVITKVSLLGSFVVHRLSATGLTLAANYLFLFYIKLMDLSSKQRILEVTSSLEFHTSRSLDFISIGVYANEINILLPMVS